MAGLLTVAQGAHTLLVGKGEPSIDNWTFKLFYKVSLAVGQGADMSLATLSWESCRVTQLVETLWDLFLTHALDKSKLKTSPILYSSSKFLFLQTQCEWGCHTNSVVNN